MTYPNVINEFETLRAMHAGMSVSRFGDGEFNLARDRDCVSQYRNPELAQELRKILKLGSTKDCAVAIPPLDRQIDVPDGKKRGFWNDNLKKRYSRHLDVSKTYYSSFITRADNMPCIDTSDYWESIIDLWRGKDVTLVLGTERSLNQSIMDDANSVNYVWTVRRDAYSEIDDIEQKIKDAGNKTVLLCVGATATCLAWRLQGDYHALDLGHIGWSVRDHKRGLEQSIGGDCPHDPMHGKDKR